MMSFVASLRSPKGGIMSLMGLGALFMFCSSQMKSTKSTALQTVRRLGEVHRELLAIDPPVLPPGDPVSENLRIVTFGASRTWGAGLGAGPNDRYGAYPFLLSSKVDNQAIRATGPEYPALCVNSMLGDEIYDVIVLEFYVDAQRKLYRLAKRLRQRFPNAVMIFLRVWGPHQFRNKKEGLPFREWFQQHGVKSLWDPDLRRILMEQSAAEDWVFDPKDQCIKAQDAAIRATNGVLFELPPPNSMDPREALAEKAHLYALDVTHFSKDGHEFITRGIQDILRSRNVQRSNVVNEWAAVDVCEDWFGNGETSGFSTHPDVRMKKFSPGKYALEIGGPVGWIKVNNPLPVDAEVHFRYMVMGPPPSKYPKTLFKVLGNGLEESQRGIEIYPTTRKFGYRVNVNQMDPVGVVPPGESTIKFVTMEEGKEWPFRITGMAITPSDDMVNSQ